MCIGGKSKTPAQQPIPAPTQPTTFDYQAARNDAQNRANTGVQQAQTATMLSETQPSGASFGSDLGGVTAKA